MAQNKSLKTSSTVIRFDSKITELAHLSTEQAILKLNTSLEGVEKRGSKEAAIRVLA